MLTVIFSLVAQCLLVYQGANLPKQSLKQSNVVELDNFMASTTEELNKFETSKFVEFGETKKSSARRSRNLLQQHDAVKIDGCNYSSADRECLHGYFSPIQTELMLNPITVESKEYPFFVSIQKERFHRGEFVLNCFTHICGGSLIQDDVVVTAAHCIQDYADITKTGLQKVTKKLKVVRESKCRHLKGVEELTVGEILVHPGYQDGVEGSVNTYQDDIALLFLNGKMKQKDALINFQDADIFQQEAENSGVLSIGFGRTSLQSSTEVWSTTLKQISTRLRSKISCVVRLQEDNNMTDWNQIYKDDKMLCARDNSREATCNGDSGGPLFIQAENGQYILFGITSWSLTNQCQSNQVQQPPNIFTRVSFYKQWIFSNVQSYSHSGVEGLLSSQGKSTTVAIASTHAPPSVEIPITPTPTPNAITQALPTEISTASTPTPTPNTNTSTQAPPTMEIPITSTPTLNVSTQAPPTIETPTASAPSVKISEVDALIAFKNVLSTDSFMNALESWEISVDHCQWEYIVCEASNVIEINLSGRELKGQLVKELSGLNYLRKFRIGQRYSYRVENYISGTLPQEFSQWTMLEEFSVDTNKLEGNFPPEYSEWAQLQIFYTMSNSFQGVLPKQYSTWGNIIEFKVQENEITGVLPADYSTFNNVVQFRVDNNKLAGNLPSEYSLLDKLNGFIIGSNSFQGSLPQQYFTWNNLKDFDVSLNQLTGSLPWQYCAWTNLEIFKTSENLITGKLPKEYSTFENLVQFIASQNQLTGSLQKEYSKLTRTTLFDVRSNKLTGDVPAEYTVMFAVIHDSQNN